eukprot:UN14089
MFHDWFLCTMCITCFICFATYFVARSYILMGGTTKTIPPFYLTGAKGVELSWKLSTTRGSTCCTRTRFKILSSSQYLNDLNPFDQTHIQWKTDPNLYITLHLSMIMKNRHPDLSLKIVYIPALLPGICWCPHCWLRSIRL